MSRRSFTAGPDTTNYFKAPRQYHVTAGWDRPLQSFFLTIEDPTVTVEAYDQALIRQEEQHREYIESCEQRRLIFDNLRLGTNGMGVPLRFITIMIFGMSITPPDNFLRDLAQDGANNAGNIVKEYTQSNA